MKDIYKSYYCDQYVLRCCEKGNESTLIGRRDGKMCIHEQQDEYEPAYEEIQFCPFCGTKITKGVEGS